MYCLDRRLSPQIQERLSRMNRAGFSAEARAVPVATPPDDLGTVLVKTSFLVMFSINRHRMFADSTLQRRV